MRKQIVLLAAVLALSVAACGDDDGAATTQPAEGTATTEAMGGGTEVSIEALAFSPGEITVSVGTTVTWTNDEAGIPHTVSSDDGVWDSGSLEPGDTFSFTFDEAGAFAYHCNIHPSMQGTIVVEG